MLPTSVFIWVTSSRIRSFAFGVPTMTPQSIRTRNGVPSFFVSVRRKKSPSPWRYMRIRARAGMEGAEAFAGLRGAALERWVGTLLFAGLAFFAAGFVFRVVRLAALFVAMIVAPLSAFREVPRTARRRLHCRQRSSRAGC